ncbi:MAG: hypothetical protein AMJ88_16475 [Anaerolineae bacterium SM23_ 63]|nr:MAG: hypothetical protein AMJ88_16475 [Anaerolineae bacterium SM23_ 63]
MLDPKHLKYASLVCPSFGSIQDDAEEELLESKDVMAWVMGMRGSCSSDRYERTVIRRKQELV